ncbi:hypothetical protein WL00_17570 [Burkholderia cepacia]|nr:hypothetical protein WL00_17570 [Burkholderia cepacia]KVX74487.1 hypothetical protein WL07_09560 [Burkholderia cepacia]
MQREHLRAKSSGSSTITCLQHAMMRRIHMCISWCLRAVGMVAGSIRARSICNDGASGSRTSCGIVALRQTRHRGARVD